MKECKMLKKKFIGSLILITFAALFTACSLDGSIDSLREKAGGGRPGVIGDIGPDPFMGTWQSTNYDDGIVKLIAVNGVFEEYLVEEGKETRRVIKGTYTYSGNTVTGKINEINTILFKEPWPEWVSFDELYEYQKEALNMSSDTETTTISGNSFISNGIIFTNDSSIVQKTLVIKDIPAQVFAYAQDGFEVGIFKTGTTLQQAIDHDTDKGVAEWSDFKHEDNVTANSGAYYIIAVPLYTFENDNWTGSGSFDVYVALHRERYYRVRNVKISSMVTVVSFYSGREVSLGGDGDDGDGSYTEKPEINFPYPRTITLTDIDSVKQSEGSDWFFFGIFPTDTEPGIVLANVKALKSQGSGFWDGFFYAGGPTDELPWEGTPPEYLSITLALKAFPYNEYWLGSYPLFDAWVLVFDGFVWNGYKLPINIQEYQEYITESAQKGVKVIENKNDQMICVGVQIGMIKANTAGSVSFSVVTENIADGSYFAMVANLPAGVSVSEPVIINNNSGILTLAGDATTVGGTYTNLKLTINGVSSLAFTLVIPW